MRWELIKELDEVNNERKWEREIRGIERCERTVKEQIREFEERWMELRDFSLVATEQEFEREYWKFVEGVERKRDSLVEELEGLGWGGLEDWCGGEKEDSQDKEKCEGLELEEEELRGRML